MSDTHDKADDAADDSEAKGPLAGERLAEARREKQIPVAEIAKELHLDEYKVRALERNEFDVIGAAVFAKGHLRKYAHLVQVPEADVMADYYELDRSAAAPLVMSPRPRRRKEMSPGPWIVAVVVVAMLAAVYWWFVVRVPAAATSGAATVVLPQPFVEREVTLPGADETDATDEPGADDTITASEIVNTSDTLLTGGSDAALEQTSASDVAASVPQDSAPGMRLTVTYSGDCWTEITDANGRRLFFDLGVAGRVVNLSGESPFNVLFGNASNVSLELNGSAFAIPAASRRGRTAKLTITAP